MRNLLSAMYLVAFALWFGCVAQAHASGRVVGMILLDGEGAVQFDDPVAEEASREAPPSRFEVLPKERLSSVLARWSEIAGYHLVWRGSGDIEIEAGMSFASQDIKGALRDLTTILAATNPGIRVRTYTNDVVVVEVRE